MILNIILSFALIGLTILLIRTHKRLNFKIKQLSFQRKQSYKKTVSSTNHKTESDLHYDHAQKLEKLLREAITRNAVKEVRHDLFEKLEIISKEHNGKWIKFHDTKKKNTHRVEDLCRN